MLDNRNYTFVIIVEWYSGGGVINVYLYQVKTRGNKWGGYVRKRRGSIESLNPSIQLLSYIRRMEWA